MQEIIVHPQVLLSITDHHSRFDLPRVIGVLLGSDSDQIHITNSFALPFDETNTNFFIDTSYFQHMLTLHRKINSKEKVLGLYHTGKVLQPNDSFITSLFSNFVSNPLLSVINLYTKNIPVKMYRQERELIPTPCRIEAEEAEDVAVEHLTRDIKTDDEAELKESLKMYEHALKIIIDYLNDIILKKIDGNYVILDEIQECLNEKLVDFEFNDDISLCFLACLAKVVVMHKDYKANRKESWENEII
ncbi:proteasome regulatory particle subunit [Gurleya vavrai]